MEAYFPSKALAIRMPSLPQGVFFVVPNHLGSVIGSDPRSSIVWASFCLPATIVRTCFDKNMVWAAPQCLCWWLHKRFFDKNTTWCTKQTNFAVTSMFCLLRMLHGVYSATDSSIKLDALEKNLCSCPLHNWINKIPKIEFFPLDWTHCSIRIMTHPQILSPPSPIAMRQNLGVAWEWG